MENAGSGFKCTGIVPFNSDILPASDFVEDTQKNVPPPLMPIDEAAAYSP